MQPPCFIIGRTAKPSRRRRPVSSTLDSGRRTFRSGRLHRSVAKNARPRQQNTTERRSAVLFGDKQKEVRRIAPLQSHSQPVHGPPPTGRRLDNGFAVQSAGSRGQRPARMWAAYAACFSSRAATFTPSRGSLQYNRAMPFRPSPEPPSNLALNRTRYGMPALGLHFILAQARHAFAGRLALR